MLTKVEVTLGKGGNISSVPGRWSMTRPIGPVYNSYNQQFPRKENKQQDIIKSSGSCFNNLQYFYNLSCFCYVYVSLVFRVKRNEI